VRKGVGKGVGSCNQAFGSKAYVGNNPVNAIDPLGLDEFRLYSWGQGFRVSGRPLEGGTIIGGPLDPAQLALYGIEIGTTLGASELSAAKFLAGISRVCPKGKCFAVS
jgi:hypothetical protein